MLKSIVNMDPLAELKAMDEMFDRMFGSPWRNSAFPASGQASAMLPLDIAERDGQLMIRAAIPGVNPEELQVTVENHVLTIRGELRNEWDGSDVKVYRREYSYGVFSRSIRLPDKLNIDAVDAEFQNGVVTISIPKMEEEKPRALRVNVRSVTKTPRLESAADSGNGADRSVENDPAAQ